MKIEGENRLPCIMSIKSSNKARFCKHYFKDWFQVEVESTILNFYFL